MQRAEVRSWTTRRQDTTQRGCGRKLRVTRVAVPRFGSDDFPIQIIADRLRLDAVANNRRTCQSWRRLHRQNTSIHSWTIVSIH